MSVKLYRHNETGEVVAATYYDLQYVDSRYKVFYDTGCAHEYSKEGFERDYTPLPEPPAEGSDEWAVAMMRQGKEVRLSSFPERVRLSCEYGKEYTTMNIGHDDWQLYEEPKPIVEKLPHEFVEGEEVLVRDFAYNCWIKEKYFKHISMETHRFQCSRAFWNYCLPYAGNEHLEGQVTEGEHGAVPKGYVPPRVPKLGDDDYWMVGDEVVDLSNNSTYKIEALRYEEVRIRALSECGTLQSSILSIQLNDFNGTGFLRVWFHKGSHVRDDGTVHEYAPTRPYRIEA